MTYALVRHRVRDFEQWKQRFSNEKEGRRNSGIQGGRLMRSVQDPNEVVLLLELSDVDKFQRFVRSTDLHSQIEQAGVVDVPDMFLLEDVEKI